MDYILVNIKEEEEDVDVETVELQPEDNRSDDFNHNLFESSLTSMPVSLSSVASRVTTNLIYTEGKVSSVASCVASCVRTNLVDTV